MSFLSLHEIEVEARQRLDPSIYDFFAGGADDELTLKANRRAFARIGLLPRVLRGAAPPVDPSLRILGCSLEMPILLAPTAFHRLAHDDGERATARAAHAARTVMVVSMASTTSLSDIAESARGPRTRSGVESAQRAESAPAELWFQLNIQPDFVFTRELVRRAEDAGCKALVVSVDCPVLGHRERDLRNGFVDLPPGLCCENMREPGSDDRSPGRVRSIVFSPELGWEHIDWLRNTTRLPIVLKGVAHPEDARLALDHGIDGLWVSNHGGRQLDTVPTAVELLPAIVRAVEGRVPIVLDGGIQRGTDVVKALALGANAVAIGRPVLWGLALGGEHGVLEVLRLLRSEFERALILCGCHSLADVRPNLVRTRVREEES